MQLTSPPGEGFSICKTAQGCGSIVSIALEEELKVLDFVLGLKYYSFVLLDQFPLFLHFLTSLD